MTLVSFAAFQSSVLEKVFKFCFCIFSEHCFLCEFMVIWRHISVENREQKSRKALSYCHLLKAFYCSRLCCCIWKCKGRLQIKKNLYLSWRNWKLCWQTKKITKFVSSNSTHLLDFASVKPTNQKTLSK